MNVMDVAGDIGLTVSHGEVAGTIDEAKVLRALAQLAEREPDDGDLFRDAAARVERSRSAGVETLHDGGGRTRPSEPGTTIQLRYRSEMADIFTDLAIDVGLRRHRRLVPTA